jgi:hypothetical protein
MTESDFCDVVELPDPKQTTTRDWKIAMRKREEKISQKTQRIARSLPIEEVAGEIPHPPGSPERIVYLAARYINGLDLWTGERDSSSTGSLLIENSFD